MQSRLAIRPVAKDLRFISGNGLARCFEGSPGQKDPAEACIEPDILGRDLPENPFKVNGRPVWKTAVLRVPVLKILCSMLQAIFDHSFYCQ